jgi:hypothetical protein
MNTSTSVDTSPITFELDDDDLEAIRGGAGDAVVLANDKPGGFAIRNHTLDAVRDGGFAIRNHTLNNVNR